MSMKPKAALVKAGILPPGSENTRGRMSKAHIAECERLVRDENYDIEGFAVSKVVPKVDEPQKVERVAAADPKRLVDVPDQNRDEREWEAYHYVDGKPVHVGFRTVCNLCHSSLGWCHCDKPEVNSFSHGAVVVYFKPRTAPQQNKR